MTPADVWNRIYADFLMPSRLGAYRELLASALRRGYEVHAVDSFWRCIQEGSVDPSRRYLVLRHDVDTDPGTARAIWQVEQALGVNGSYYFRLSTINADFAERIAAAGGEASYHYEELASVAKRHRLRRPDDALHHLPEARDEFRRNLTGLRSATGLPMRSVASHGDFVNRKLGLPNWHLLSDREFRRQVGVDVETYDDKFMRHVTSRHADTGHPRYWLPGEPMAAIDAGQPVLYLLIHPRAWRVDRRGNLVDDLRRVEEGLRYTLPRWGAT